MRWISPSFMWMSNFNIDPQALPYTNWRAHQPGSDTGVVCLREQFTFTWDNVPETAEKRYFVCKKVGILVLGKIIYQLQFFFGSSLYSCIA